MADDDIDTGPIVSGEVAPAPSEGPRVIHVPDKESREQLVKGQFNAGLGLMAHATEDATDFIKERQTQERFLEGEDLSPQQMREWHERTHAALQRAVDVRAQALGEPTSQQQAPQQLPNYVAPDAPDYDEHFEAAKQRFTDYFDNPNRIGDQNTAAEHKANVTNWLTTLDPQGRLTGYFMGSELGPVMAEALVSEPQVIPHLLSLPPQQQAREMAKLEGFIAAKVIDAQQNAAYQEPQTQVRKFSQAPPPISPPRGGANPPRDLRSLATKDNVDDYVKSRREQERRAFQEDQLDRWR